MYLTQREIIKGVLIKTPSLSVPAQLRNVFSSHTVFLCSHISSLILRDSCLTNQVSPYAMVMTTGNVMGLLVAAVKDTATETFCFLTLSATVYIVPGLGRHTPYIWRYL